MSDSDEDKTEMCDPDAEDDDGARDPAGENGVHGRAGKGEGDPNPVGEVCILADELFPGGHGDGTVCDGLLFF